MSSQLARCVAPDQRCGERIGRLTAVLLGGVLGVSVAAPALAAPEAETIYVGADVYTGNRAQPWAQGLAVAHGKILAVGTDADVRALAGPATRVVELRGRMLMPGLVDDHVHATEGAAGALYSCLFPSTSGPAGMARALKACVKATPKGGWITGGFWSSTFFEEHHIGSPRRWLDAITGDRPLIWRDDTGHNAWANSAALKLAGIDAKTPDPTGGRFEREADGVTPNGVAYEAASEQVQAVIPPLTGAQQRACVEYGQRVAHAFGIVGLKEADASVAQIAAYREADRAGALRLYVAADISTLASQDRPDRLLDFDAIDKVRDAYQGDLLRTDFVKIYLDGVPTPARTAAMLDPYVADASGARVRGDLHVNPDVLARDIVELDRRGYTVKMHAAGDGSVREGLDAIAAARAANPHGTLRHELGHAGFIAPEDIGRFASLNAVAEFSPVIWYPSPIIDAVIEAVGERGRHYWPMRSLVASGAHLAAGSDWPSVVPSMDPWTGIQAMVTRADPVHPSAARLWPEEAITLEDAIAIYTLGGAQGIKREAQTGTLEAGKSADFIVLDRNLFKIPPQQITSRRVEATYFRGEEVYRRGSTPPPDAHGSASARPKRSSSAAQ